MQYEDALSWIHGISRFGMNQGLERIEALMELLGEPQKKLKCLHIGGTNGKGSTAAFASSILEAAGYRVGLYTSPYLIQFTNRMSINGQDIAKERLVELVERVKPLVERITQDPALGQPTEFEVVTAIAFTYFAEESPDIVVVEVGLGGRLDATNVIQPLVTALAPISLEHTQVLGDTVGKIALEKAGIIKEGSVVVTEAAGEALEVLEKVCCAKKVTLYKLQEDFKVEKVSGSLRGQALNYYGLFGNYAHLQIPLLGDYQRDNAALALAAIELLGKRGFQVSEEAVRKGLAATTWPGRLEVVRRSPLILLDGAHNLAAFQGLQRNIRQNFAYRRLILVLGLLDDKAAEEILQEIIPVSDHVVITTPNSPRAADPHVLERITNRYTLGPVFVQEKIPDALNLALSLAGEEDLILIAGSLYLISDARQLLQDPAQGSGKLENWKVGK